MSRIPVISEAIHKFDQAEKELSNLIHKTFKSDQEIWYQDGMSEHISSWHKYVIVGPFNKYQIIIRPVGGGPTVYVDGRWDRIRLDWNDVPNKTKLAPEN
jgi:hypothetical protein